MGMWLREDVPRLRPSPFVDAGVRGSNGTEVVSVFLRHARVLNNRRLWRSADVLLYIVAIDGHVDSEEDAPFWSQSMFFPRVKDGSTLPIDPNQGWLGYRGTPGEFVNFYLLAMRDSEATRRFSKLLKENMAATGIGRAAGAAVSIFSGPDGTLAAPLAREVTERAVDTTLDYFSRKQDLAIGAYYGSLVAEKNYGEGLNPADYPLGTISCGDALEIAYEVTRVRT